MSQKTRGQHGQWDSSSWLMRSTLWPMVAQFEKFSADYDMGWRDDWVKNYSNIGWLTRAMRNTFSRLSDEDKELIRDEYELFLEHDVFCDWEAMVNPSFDALCYVIDGQGQRVESEGVLVTVVRELAGSTKEVAGEKLDTDCYEFIEWM